MTLWRDRSDDHLPEHLGFHTEVAQAEAWLKATDHDWYDDWRNAHQLAHGLAESEADQHRIVQEWHEATNAAGDRVDVASSRDGSDVEKDLRRSRELRLNRAKTWFMENNPDYYPTWKQCQDFADSIDDEKHDDRELVRRWLHRTGQTDDPRGLLIPPSQRAAGMTEPLNKTADVGTGAAPADGVQADGEAADAGDAVTDDVDAGDPEPGRPAGTVGDATAERLTRSATRGPNTPQTAAEQDRRAYIQAGDCGLHAAELATGDDEPNNAVLAQLAQLHGGGHLNPSTIYAITSHEHVEQRERDSSTEAIQRARHALNRLTQPAPAPSDNPNCHPPRRATGTPRVADNGPALD